MDAHDYYRITSIQHAWQDAVSSARKRIADVAQAQSKVRG